MPLIDIGGVPVDFPFTPYDSQKDFMSKVVQALQENKNALLESPTGTGKTLCLLCASLAWLERYQVEQQMLRAQCLSSSQQSQLLEEQLKRGDISDQLPSGFGNSRVRVIYASRTHSQLSQVMKELKRTAYCRFRSAIIASRDQLCVHPVVSKETSNQVKQASCRIKKQTRTCHFYNNVEKKKDLKAFHNPEDISSNILDIEDLLKFGNKHKCCPYFLTRAAAKDHADIIFMPYNYLIDARIRKRHGIELTGSIVIFDEAHNLNQVAEESSSVEISAAEITSALQEVDVVVQFVEEFGKEALEGDNFSSSGGEDGVNFELLTVENVLRAKSVLLDVEKELMDIDLGKEGEKKFEGQFVYTLLEKARLKFDTYLAMYDVIDACVGYLTGGGYSGIHQKAYGLGRVLQFIKVVFDSDSYNLDKPAEYRAAHVSKFYRVYVYDKDPPKPHKKSFWESKDATNQKVRVLCFWCFSPAFSMMDLQKQGVRCILLTSGTLKPLDSFSSELGISFPVRIENPHVIIPSQISVSVVKQGPESVTLNSNYQNRSDPKYHTSLGYAVMQIAKAVPNGMLVFFPSYYIMKMIIESWRSGHIMQCIERYKSVFIEPTNKEEFHQAMEQYYTMINDNTANGAIFCGVCRGKVSEGVDFVDKNGRAVVITGIPYAPAKDAKIVMKKSFLDQQLRNSNCKGSLTGSQWYNQQASRAVNQAIGRVIRHRFDYGAILLLDTRFASPSARGELPGWVSSQLVVHEKFSSVIRSLNSFFSTVQTVVCRRKEELAVDSQPLSGTSPSEETRLPLYPDSVKEGGRLSARSIYCDGVRPELNQDVCSSSSQDVTSQPVKKKIKMQMVCTQLDESPLTSTPLSSTPLSSTPLSSTPLSSSTSKSKPNKKVESAVEALHKCRQLLTKEEMLSVKKSVLGYHRSREMADMETCLHILLEKDATHHVVACFRELINSKQLAQFDELVAKLKTENLNSSTSKDRGSSEMPNEFSQTKYAATLSLFTYCKRNLQPAEMKAVKSALVSYKNKGGVRSLVTTIRCVGAGASPVIFSKLRGALKEEDKLLYDELTSGESSRLTDDSPAEDISSLPTADNTSTTSFREHISAKNTSACRTASNPEKDCIIPKSDDESS